MNAKPRLPRRSIGTTLAAVALSALIAVGLLSSVTGAFLRDGTPFEQLVVAERACSDYAFVSARETCVRLFLATTRADKVASR